MGLCGRRLALWSGLMRWILRRRKRFWRRACTGARSCRRGMFAGSWIRAERRGGRRVWGEERSLLTRAVRYRGHRTGDQSVPGVGAGSIAGGGHASFRTGGRRRTGDQSVPGVVAPYSRRRSASRIVSMYSYSARKASRQRAQLSRWRSNFHISSAFSRRRANCSSKSTAGCSSFFTASWVVDRRGEYSHPDYS